MDITNIKLGRNEYIDLKGNVKKGISKLEHAKEIQRLRKKGYTLEQIQEFTGVKKY